MIRFIASDLDGTLLQNGNRELSKEFIDLAYHIDKKGIMLAAASGRQYPNIKRLFKPIEEAGIDIVYICENGALVVYKDQILYKSSMNRDISIELMKDIYSQKDCEILLSGMNTSYLLPKEESYVDHMVNHVGNNVKVVNSIENEVFEEFYKISIYNKNGIDRDSNYFLEKWTRHFTGAVSGKCWMDFNAIGVNKGNAIKNVLRRFNIDYKEAMAFGDNYNDIDMFNEVYYSYAMAASNAEIRSKARYCSINVETVLKDILR